MSTTLMTKRSYLPMILLFLASLCFSCKDDNQSAQQDQKEIRDITKKIEHGFNTKNLDELMFNYADSYTDINLPKPVQTNLERRNYYQNVIEKSNLKIQIDLKDVIVDKQQAVSWGNL